MSHARSWRAACLITITNPSIHFELHFHSTRRDSCGRWLWRLVRRLGNEEQSDITSENNVRANRSQASKCHPLSENNSPFVGSAWRTRSRRCHLAPQHSRRIFEQRRDRIYAHHWPSSLRPRTRAPSSRVARHSSALMRRPRHRQSSVIDHTYQLSL
jgi:hypothetical protein